MKIRVIFEDDKTIVKEVWVYDNFLYTVTYIKDEDGFCNKMIKVYANGTIEIQ